MVRETHLANGSSTETIENDLQAVSDTLSNIPRPVATPAESTPVASQMDEAAPPPWLATLLAAMAPKEKPRRRRLPDPEHFDGDKKKFPNWIYNMKSKLVHDKEDFDNERKACDYVFSRVKGTAATLIKPYLKNMENKSEWNTDNLVRFMETMFGDPHAAERARDKLMNLMQGKRSLRTYAMEFQELVFEAETSVDESLKMTIFRKGLSLGIQKQLAGRLYNNTDELMNAALAIADDLYRINLYSGKGRGGPPYKGSSYRRRNSTPPSDSDGMDGVEYTGKSSTRDQRRNRDRHSPNTTRWLRDEKRCYNCKEKGHYASACRGKGSSRRRLSNSSDRKKHRTIHSAKAAERKRSRSPPIRRAKHDERARSNELSSDSEGYRSTGESGKEVAPAESHQQEPRVGRYPDQEYHSSKKLRTRWARFEKEYMRCKAITVEALVNSAHFASMMIDTGNLTYSLVSPVFAKKAGLQCLDIKPRQLSGVNGEPGRITQVVRFKFNIEGYNDYAWGYVAPEHPGFDVILGRAWMNRRNVTIAPRKGSIYVHNTGQRIRLQSSEGRPRDEGQKLAEIDANAYALWLRKSRENGSDVQTFAVSLADIQKALAPKTKVDHMALLPEAHKHLGHLFDPANAAKLPPHRGPKVDHTIEFNKDKDGEAEYFVDRILRERKKKKGRGYVLEYLVKWKGYERPDWQPSVNLVDTEALSLWKRFGKRVKRSGDHERR